jgi:endonuclease YncB( thermonuclease family)
MLKELWVAGLLALGAVPSVTDGDTVKVAGVSIRLVDYDAPELFHPRCLREYLRAQEAKRELERLAPSLTFTMTPCATHNYGRLCARAGLGARPLAEYMIRSQLGAPYICTRGCPPKPNWC